MPAVRLAAAIDQFLAASSSTVAPATLALYRHYLRRFLAWAGDIPLRSITPARLMTFSSKYHPASCVQRLLSWATIEARLIVVNPLLGMRKARNGHRRRILSRAELVRVLRSGRPAFRAFALAMVESLARPREIREVRWGDIRTSGAPTFAVADLVSGRAFFWFDKFKGQKLRRDRYAVRVIPISRRLGRSLARAWGKGRPLADVVFRNVRGAAWTYNAVRCQMRRLRARAGLTADLRGECVVAYSLRHTSATDAVGAGVVGFTLAELMGHSDIRMTQRYVHLRPDHLIEATGRISEWKLGRKAKIARLGSLRPRVDGQ